MHHRDVMISDWKKWKEKGVSQHQIRERDGSNALNRVCDQSVALFLVLSSIFFATSSREWSNQRESKLSMKERKRGEKMYALVITRVCCNGLDLVQRKHITHFLFFIFFCFFFFPFLSFHFSLVHSLCHFVSYYSRCNHIRRDKDKFPCKNFKT